MRTVVLRLGIVFGPGGALRPMLLPHYVGFGGRLGDGAQVMSWIHRDDVLRIVARAMSDPRMQGVYNAVAPAALSQREFVQVVAKVLRRPAWLHLPAAPLRCAMGEMAELLLDGQRVTPARLQQYGFVFRFPTAEHALRDLTGR
ncbi:Epimerase family protein [Burkholderia pseudomultivorans]|uniref:Epimerase family protein n=1 Tax=Burkholderia pseudomultivorans TaxID=1207504 RepID=A0ABU2DWR1_9BURK|nr:Epimerase family protein [Burkholderia pseudomultivorans]MDR8734885.1 Epimerase family protein [Burkholderia pseudomultivorans]MDR8740846.1 Epimerase family protein [Burkholderia pseudomultivorans]MDR8751934.1 Epimerase family protein [Burkholderia pseudomultivorans]MDR8777260.1 Epimerase family protein [Burkholderia pseudomultivorans]